MTALSGAASPTAGKGRGSDSVLRIIVRLVLLGLIDAFAIWLIYELVIDDVAALAIAVGVLTVFANVVILRDEMFPIRWMLIGLILMALFAIYPIIYTVFVAFTNYGDEHLFTKDEAIIQLERAKYLPETGQSFTWTAYQAPDGSFALWLQDAEGQNYLVRPGQAILSVSPGEEGVGELDENGVPVSIEGYERLNRLQLVRYINDLGKMSFGADDFVVQVRSLDAAAEMESLYKYDPEQDVIVNQETGVVYTPIDGTFTSPTGEKLIPGYRATIGLENFTRFFTGSALAGPLARITIWNFVFAFLSVAMTFALGLAIAILYNDETFAGRKFIRTLLIIPYTIPSLITILIWRGMLNPDLGVINRLLEDLIGWAPPWFTNPWWAKAGVLLVNLWLGYPYFMLVCSGALQAIPQDIYGAAEVDGAGVWQRFRLITFPLLLVAVGPLLVASFVFNFNNFNIIFLFIQGGPPIAGAATRAGHTDILISYVYNLAFGGGRGADYGFAAAITIIIFFIVAIITLFQFRYTRMWEEVGENV